MSEGRLIFDLISSKVVKIGLGLELLLTIICVLLLFFLPKSGGGLLIAITVAIFILITIGALLFLRYSKNSAYKDKKEYLIEKSKLKKNITANKAELNKIEKAVSDNLAREQSEIETLLHDIQSKFINAGLRDARIETANISGVGPKLKEKLRVNRITSAADVGFHITNLEGFGKAKVDSLLEWKSLVLAQLESGKPKTLPEAQLSEIKQRYRQQKEALISKRENLQSNLTIRGLELQAVNKHLSQFADVTFLNYINLHSFNEINNPSLKKISKQLLIVFLGLGTIIYATFCFISTGAIASSRPTATPTITLTPTTKPSTTPTPSLTPTLTFTPMRTPTFTITPTDIAYFYNLASCLPKNTLVQYGKVVEVVDGDTIRVTLDNGSEQRVRYIGVDSPEANRPFYSEAVEANKNLVSGIEVILIKDVSETDSFSRLLRYVIVDKTFVNMDLVRKGLAVAESYPPDIACDSTFASVMEASIASKAGIWQATPTSKPSGAKVVIVAVNKVAEYVDIHNIGNSDVDLSGWTLVSEKGNQSCGLSGILKAGATLRIWAGYSTNGGYSCGYSTTIWNNSSSDPAVLYNAQGIEVSRY